MTTASATPVNTLLKRTAPVGTAKDKKAKKDKKQQAVAFLNWAIPLADGKEFRSGKGFPIFQNPNYPNPQEDMLVELAKSHDGIVELTMKVRIVINTAADLPDLSEFVLG